MKMLSPESSNPLDTIGKAIIFCSFFNLLSTSGCKIHVHYQLKLSGSLERITVVTVLAMTIAVMHVSIPYTLQPMMYRCYIVF